MAPHLAIQTNGPAATQSVLDVIIKLPYVRTMIYRMPFARPRRMSCGGAFAIKAITFSIPKSTAKFSLGEIEDLFKPDVRMLDGATRCGYSRHIHITMQPRRNSPGDCRRALDLRGGPTAAKIDGKSAHRRVLTPGEGRAIASIMERGGSFYDNTVAAFGVASACQNWDRLASADHRWELKLVKNGMPT